MSFIQRELDRIGGALESPQSGNRYAELYAVQQALVWALDPMAFKSPFDLIEGVSILEDAGDCQAGSDHSRS